MKNKINLSAKLNFLLIVGILFLSLSSVSAANSFSGGVPTSFSGSNYRVYGASVNPQFTQPSFYGGSETDILGYWNNFNKEDCKERQDVILMIPPGGCSPSVVRSDLLEEQDVPVFCKVSSIQVNPLIDITKIRSIHFKGANPPGVAGMSYFPARIAVRSDSKLIGSPIADNVGYLVIKLRKTPNENNMLDWVGGNVTAVVDYDSKEVFGVGQHDFYLTETSEEEWQDQYKSFGFWKGKGYIRLESLDEDSARISIYRDAVGREASVDVKKGETSRDIYLGGYYCAAGMNIKVEDIGYPVDTALLRVDDEDLWVGKGSSFLNEKCKVTDLEVNEVGGGKASFSCTGAGRFTLLLKDAGINLEVENPLSGKEKEDTYVIGDKITSRNGTDVYLAYVGKYPGSKITYNVLAAIPSGSQQLSGLGSFINNRQSYWVNGGKRKEQLKTAFTWATNAGSLGIIATSTIMIASGGIAIPVIIAIGGITGATGAVVSASIADEERDFYNYLTEQINDNYPVKSGEITILRGEGLKWEKYGITLKKPASGEALLQNNLLLKENYENATLNYEEVFNLYPGEKERADDTSEPYAVEALYNAADLSKLLGMQSKQIEYLEKLIKNYPDAKLAKDAEIELERAYEKKFSADSQAVAYVNNEPHFISLIDIKKPSYEDLGAELEVFDKGKLENFKAAKDEIKITRESRLNFKIIDIKDTSVEVEYYEGLSFVSNVVNWGRAETIGKKKTIELGKIEQITKDVSIKLIDTNLEKTAKVKIIPKEFGMRTESNFEFKIGIEKRGIKLSPKKTREMITNLEKNIKNWEDINEKLGKVVTGLKGACFATSAVLIVKNFFSGLSGEAMARNEVMTTEGGWNDKCRQWSGKSAIPSPEGKTYSSVQTCLLDHNDEINNAVSQYKTIIEKENELMKKLEEENKISGGDILDWQGQVDQNKLKQAYCEKYFKPVYNQDTKVDIKGVGENMPLGEVISPANAKNCSVNNLELDDMKMIVLKSRVDSTTDPVLKEVINNKLKTGLVNTYNINKLNVNQGVVTQTFGNIPVFSDEGKKRYQVMSDVKNVNIGGKAASFGSGVTKVFGDVINNKKVAVGLSNKDNDNYVVSQILDENGNDISNAEYTKDGKNNSVSYREYYSYYKNIDEFTIVNSNYYNNKFKETPKVKYYERAPYQGLPSQVPIGKVGQTNGWYVSSDYILSGFGKPYEESGRAANFWICNVGENGLIDGKSRDDCRYYNLGSSADLKFPGLSAGDSAVLVSKAESGIREASSQYGKSKVTINGQVYGTEIAENGESGNCADFMSPADCNLMFNVCDPVMCPESRCDYGGKYRVGNVIQSGIIGSLLLCLPNAQEGVMIPICLSGVHAGIEGYLSILKSTRDCLNESLATGRSIGICDEIKSIYMCEFFWRQAAPLMDVFIPNIFEAFTGQGVRGGGEYLTIDYAWKNVQNSIDYFKNEYAVNAMKAFNQRSTAGVGEEVCKSFVSASYPNGDLIGNLLEPDSPVQYHAWFSENVLTEATIPPTSHYKVYYHIYAGKDIGAHYVVYLKSPPDSSMVHTLGTYVVDRNYIEKGQQVDIARDFTGVSGYQELCISINGQDECGFKQVSTSWAVDELSRQYAAGQATDRVAKASECVAGEPSLYSLANPNLQAGAQETINPELYKRGIIRVCSSENPGKSITPSGTIDATNSSYDGWMRVGDCDTSAVGCWLDTKSVQNVLSDAPGLLNETLDKVKLDYVDKVEIIPEEKAIEILKRGKEIKDLLAQQGNIYFSLEEASKDQNTKYQEAVEALKAVTEKGVDNKYKAKAFLTIGRIYDEFARKNYKKHIKELKVVPESTKTEVKVAGELTLEPLEIGTQVKDSLGNIWEMTSSMQNGKYIWKSSVGYYTWDMIPSGSLYMVKPGTAISEGFWISSAYSDRVIFKFQDGKNLVPNLYYRFNNEKWQWSMDKSVWEDVSLDPKTRDSDNVLFIKSLVVAKTYKEGLELLISRTINNKDNQKPALVVFKDEQEFKKYAYNNLTAVISELRKTPATETTINKEEFDWLSLEMSDEVYFWFNGVYYIFFNGEWQFYFYTGGYFPVTDDSEVADAPIEEQEFIKSLGDKGYQEGLVLLIDKVINDPKWSSGGPNFAVLKVSDKNDKILYYVNQKETLIVKRNALLNIIYFKIEDDLLKEGVLITGYSRDKNSECDYLYINNWQAVGENCVDVKDKGYVDGIGLIAKKHNTLKIGDEELPISKGSEDDKKEKILYILKGLNEGKSIYDLYDALLTKDVPMDIYEGGPIEKAKKVVIYEYDSSENKWGLFSGDSSLSTYPLDFSDSYLSGLGYTKGILKISKENIDWYMDSIVISIRNINYTLNRAFRETDEEFAEKIFDVLEKKNLDISTVSLTDTAQTAAQTTNPEVMVNLTKEVLIPIFHITSNQNIMYEGYYIYKDGEQTEYFLRADNYGGYIIMKKGSEDYFATIKGNGDWGVINTDPPNKYLPDYLKGKTLYKDGDIAYFR